MRRRLVFVAGLSIVAAAAWSEACGGNVATTAAGSGGAGGGAPSCTAGAERPCDASPGCPGNVPGFQFCSAAGSWGSCTCPPMPTGTGGAPSWMTSAGPGGGGGSWVALPPAPGPMQAPDGSGTVTFAVTRLYLGDTDRDGTQDLVNGWKNYGYNLDGLPPGDLAGACKTVLGAPPAQDHEEGYGGIENAYGHNVLPIVLGIASDAATKINQTIAAGKWTFLISLQGLGSGAGYNPLPATFDLGATLASAPHFDGTDVWPPLMGTESSLPESYLTGDTWVSGPASSITLTLVVSGFALGLQINRPILSMKLDAAHQKATYGVIAGVIPTASLVGEIEKAGICAPGCFCCGDPPPLQAIIDQISQASDILHDGTQDPTKQCDGISIGMGFDAVLVELGPAVPPPPPPPACPCDPDAG